MPWLSFIASNIVLASLLALAATVVQRRLARPDVARILWVLTLVKLVTPPLVSVPLFQLGGALACSLGGCNCAEHAGMLGAGGNWLWWGLLIVWATGAVATLAVAARRWAQFQRLVAHARPAPAAWQALTARLAAKLSMRRPPEVLTLSAQIPPLAAPGWRGSRILLPAELLDRLNDSQQAAMLLHEMVHIRRGDHLVRLLELTVRVAYWWLPIAGLIGRQLRTCEESGCDAEVVSHLPEARRDYARLLLDVLDFAKPLPPKAVPQATAMSAANDLERRLHTILDDAQSARRTWPLAALAAGLACMILPCRLHYDFPRRDYTGQPAAELTESSTSDDAAYLPGGDRQREQFAVYCCPT